MRKVIIESRYAGNVALNTEYARACLRDSLSRGEAPIASHLLYPQVLDDNDPAERAHGIAAGLAWRDAPDALPAFYLDFGSSSGMLQAFDLYARERRDVEARFLFREASAYDVVQVLERTNYTSTRLDARRFALSFT